MRVGTLSLPLALTLVGRAVASPQSQPILRNGDKESFRANAVKDAFQHAWDGYMKYAFPHDELHPISNGHGDSRYVPVIAHSNFPSRKLD